MEEDTQCLSFWRSYQSKQLRGAGRSRLCGSGARIRSRHTRSRMEQLMQRSHKQQLATVTACHLRGMWILL
uniref:Uncharacterized protein n=1 Tax=Arundo donax TaxID=35708 RepID=A0A0A9DH67_ARUDO